MLGFSALSFGMPWVLAGLLALPVIWLILRVVPPAPLRQHFPGVVLLLGLEDRQNQSDRTPWWLLLLRMLALALAIIAFSGPVWQRGEIRSSDRPLLIVFDGTWAETGDWGPRLERARQEVAQAQSQGRLVAVLRLSDDAEAIDFKDASDWAPRLVGLEPQAWNIHDLSAWAQQINALDRPNEFDTFWLSNGLFEASRPDLFHALQARGTVRVLEGNAEVLALHPPQIQAGELSLQVSRLRGNEARDVDLLAYGPDPAGIERELARIKIGFAPQERVKLVPIELPIELRNRVTRFEISNQPSAGAVSLGDDNLKRPKIALIQPGAVNEGLQLLSPLHYLREALRPSADLIEASLLGALNAAPDVVVLADVARLTAPEEAALSVWLEKGGTLLRFAGPKLAMSDVGLLDEDPFLPVRLREGGRNMGGAMSWGEPKTLLPFAEDSPFFGLDVPKEVEIRAQVLAQPDPDLALRSIALLEDGTPLVTRQSVGDGQVVLFHITANAEWSSLPLSGLFMQMLERLTITRRAPGVLNEAQRTALASQIFLPDLRLDAWGARRDGAEASGVRGAELLKALETGPNAMIPTGLYSGAGQRFAVNALVDQHALQVQTWPSDITVEPLHEERDLSLKVPLLLAAFGLFLLDALASLGVAGRLWPRQALLWTGLCFFAISVFEPPAFAQGTRQDLPRAVEDFALRSTSGVVLAYVKSGDRALDELSHAGLLGLSAKLAQRSAIEPEPPMAVDIEADDLSFFPFIYWPISAKAELPSAQAYEKINNFLRTGGMILFDTRDGDLGGANSAESVFLQKIAAGLDIPALEPVPQDHVLTRSFYLLQDFPGRQTGSVLWVEAAPEQAEIEDGMPFRNLNDGVTPVVIGGNDWAAAWAEDERGAALLPVGRGAAGDRQRELAYRFGVNLIMYVLTGNYKSDQVHVPALLERLGQ